MTLFDCLKTGPAESSAILAAVSGKCLAGGADLVPPTPTSSSAREVPYTS